MLANFAARSNALLPGAYGGNIMKSTITFAGALSRAALIALAVFVPAMALFSGASSTPKAAPRPEATERHCVPVGGTVMTNFGVITPTSTLGTATGDLRGAVSASLLGPPEAGAGNTVIFRIQHHFVTETGDTIFIDPATATSVPIGPGLFAILSYPVHIKGGTGKFAGATGDFTNIGEVLLPNAPDTTGGTTVFRYTGQVCFGE
jgi:hypothetical protein